MDQVQRKGPYTLVIRPPRPDLRLGNLDVFDFFFFSIISNRTAGQKVKLLHSGGKVLYIESLQMSEDKLGEMSIFFFRAVSHFYF